MCVCERQMLCLKQRSGRVSQITSAAAAEVSQQVERPTVKKVGRKRDLTY